MDLIYKGLNDATRRDILVFLTDGPKNAGQIAKQFDMSKPSISHHLDLLKQAQLIHAEKKGQFVIYSLNQTGFLSIHEWTMQFAKNFELPKPKIRL